MTKEEQGAEEGLITPLPGHRGVRRRKPPSTAVYGRRSRPGGCVEPPPPPRIAHLDVRDVLGRDPLHLLGEPNLQSGLVRVRHGVRVKA